ncbi:MAG: electron transfer flavoprotein subunit beta/FixA family protein [Phascolarctobacterium sp.]|nr:electron transfer flavoprotein subunit beta/FixA family protein [Phascolarctobacterium sp.]
MNIIVCLKQVPDIETVKLDHETHTLIRSGVENIMNQFDRQALEAALELKDKFGGKVTALTMGLPQAADILKEAIAMGADDALLVSDPALGGSDTLATSMALAAAVQHIGDYDLILCGKQSADGDTAQVGPEMAEHLSIPQITGSLTIKYENDTFIIERENESTARTLSCQAPLLVTVTKSDKEPRFASIKGKMKARKTEIPVVSATDLKLNTAIIGLTGSPTKVIKVFTPEVSVVQSEIINEEDADKAVDMLFEKLVQAQIITR